MHNFKTDSQGPVIFLADEAASQAFAVRMAQWCEALSVYQEGFMVYLQGDLGAGKSFLSRAFIQHFLPDQKVKSPTYSLVESYKAYKFSIHHFDLYRLCDPEELEYLAIRDLLTGPFVALVEWAKKGEGVLPEADLVITLQPEIRDQVHGRVLRMQAPSPLGKRLLQALSES
jgi:tRNA threonylcarbamoyladenosine biosynthesis protein TsaE